MVTARAFLYCSSCCRQNKWRYLVTSGDTISHPLHSPMTPNARMPSPLPGSRPPVSQLTFSHTPTLLCWVFSLVEQELFRSIEQEFPPDNLKMVVVVSSTHANAPVSSCFLEPITIVCICAVGVVLSGVCLFSWSHMHVNTH